MSIRTKTYLIFVIAAFTFLIYEQELHYSKPPAAPKFVKLDFKTPPFVFNAITDKTPWVFEVRNCTTWFNLTFNNGASKIDGIISRCPLQPKNPKSVEATLTTLDGKHWRAIWKEIK